MTWSTTDEYVKAIYGIDPAEERRMAEAEIDNKDLDETRRLLYMVQYGGLTTERWHNLAGTLTNAIVHHSRLAHIDEVRAYLMILHEEATEHASSLGRDARVWVQYLIDKITAQLDDAPDPMP